MKRPVIALLYRIRGIAEGSVYKMYGEHVVTFKVKDLLETIDAVLAELEPPAPRGPQVINDTCVHCAHPSERHEAGSGKCFRCDPLNRCARFVAHDHEQKDVQSMPTRLTPKAPVLC